MKLSPQQQEELLELATLSRALKHNSHIEPEPSEEHKELARLVDERERMVQAASSAQLAVDDMELEIARIQADETKLRRREADDKRQLGASIDRETRKDLEHDLYSVKSRIADLMSELQEAHNQIHALRNNVAVHGAHLSELDRKIELASRAADAAPTAWSLQEKHERIAHLRATLPHDSVALFDQSFAENGVGVAKFNGRSCSGCFITLPPVEIAKIRQTPADELAQCPDCNSYLVR
ncbi:hypothetical protein EML15_02510 [Corynebacterium sp. sy017]|uniref:zinc ribbon domain-containing protein n=1 Tax=unclassified Corynebacterium TaxID=2624378 RepID=UPI0011869F5E|nr:MULTISPECIES: C4-type zinc ribbon domain-containing protein [unclassified Corynebacterium]MBP3088029.1 hypothetical protein [Corynebacterium sp. sy017]TSD92558.1 hypothetical protein ELY17_02510 [Corynebacterium sp. SY003]